MAIAHRALSTAQYPYSNAICTEDAVFVVGVVSTKDQINFTLAPIDFSSPIGPTPPFRNHLAEMPSFDDQWLPDEEGLH